MRLARERNINSISFPAISTGIYGYPIRQATEIALSTVNAELKEHPHPQLVRFIVFTEEDEQVYREVMLELFGPKCPMEVPTRGELGDELRELYKKAGDDLAREEGAKAIAEYLGIDFEELRKASKDMGRG
jgi:hypothetical protein